MASAVVIADDHPMFLNGVRAVINAAPGFTVVGEARDAEEAVARVLELRPRLAVLDMTMPGYSGVEATRKIKHHAPQIRVLILTMHTELRYIAGALHAGANGYLLKDSARGELVNALRVLLQGCQYYSPAIAELAHAAMHDRSSKPAALADTLSEREREILIHIANGATTKIISRTLNVSPKTVATHREHLMRKTGRHTAVELTRFAIGAGLIPAEE